MITLSAATALHATVDPRRGEDLARIHLDAIGGPERVQALFALRALGYTEVGGTKIRFIIWAERPHRIRMETMANGRGVTQAWDGVAAPWQQRSALDGLGPVETMPKEQAADFKRDAEFDDPLINWADRGYAIDFAGEFPLGDHIGYKLLVTRDLVDSIEVFIDGRTFFILAQAQDKETEDGKIHRTETHYYDFRPVEGVILPHRLEVLVDGKVRQTIVLEKLVANPRLTADLFAPESN